MSDDPIRSRIQGLLAAIARWRRLHLDDRAAELVVSRSTAWRRLQAF